MSFASFLQQLFSKPTPLPHTVSTDLTPIKSAAFTTLQSEINKIPDFGTPEINQAYNNVLHARSLYSENDKRHEFDSIHVYDLNIVITNGQVIPISLDIVDILKAIDEKKIDVERIKYPKNLFSSSGPIFYKPTYIKNDDSLSAQLYDDIQPVLGAVFLDTLIIIDGNHRLSSSTYFQKHDFIYTYVLTPKNIAAYKETIFLTQFDQAIYELALELNKLAFSKHTDI